MGPSKRPPGSKDSKIEDAKIIEEIDFVEMDRKKAESKQSSQDTKNLQGTETVDLNAKKEKVAEKVSLNFMDEDHVKDFIKSKTKESDAPNESQFKDEVTAEDIKAAEEQSKQKFTSKDMEEIAKVIILFLDSAISTGLRFWAKDNSDYGYSLPEAKKKMLEYQLTLILVKYQAKFSIEFMFILTLFIVYSVPFSKANKRRKELKNAESEINSDLDQGQDRPLAEEVNVGGGKKRGRGNPGK